MRAHLPSLGADALRQIREQSLPWVGLIEGEPASKANSRRAVPRGGKTVWIKSDKAMEFTIAAVKQLSLVKPPEPIEGDLIMVCRIWYRTRRPDLDESLVMDCLQKAAVIVNDRQIKEKHVYHAIDRERPRVLVELKAREGVAA